MNSLSVRLTTKILRIMLNPRIDSKITDCDALQDGSLIFTFLIQLLGTDNFILSLYSYGIILSPLTNIKVLNRDPSTYPVIINEETSHGK
jgi:hypothetical protein